MQQHSRALIPRMLESLVGIESVLVSILQGAGLALLVQYLPVGIEAKLAIIGVVALTMWALHAKYKGILLAHLARHCMRNAEQRFPAHMATRGGRLSVYEFVRFRSLEAKREVRMQLAAVPFYMAVGALLSLFDVSLLAAIPALLAAPLTMIYVIDGFRIFGVSEANSHYIHGSIDANAFVRGLNA